MTRISRSIGIAISVTLFVVIAVIVFVAWGLYALVPGTINYVTERISTASGLNPYLIRGVVIIATIPFFWALAKSFRTMSVLVVGGFGNPRLSMYRSVYGIVVVTYIGAFYLTMYFSARTNYYKERCITTPEGLRSFFDLKQDPIYGLQTHPCTLKEIVELRRRETQVPEPRPVSVLDARSFPFFDQVTGKPKVWYYRRADGSYALFDHAGDYPGTGDPLKPVDETVRVDLIRQQQSAEQQQKQQRLQAAQKAQETAVAELINPAIRRQSGMQQAAILILSQDASSVTTVENEVAEALRQRGVSPVMSFFKPAFIQDGRAARLFDGDWSVAEGLNLAAHVNLVVIGSATSTFSSSTNLDNVMSAHTQIELRCLDTATQSSCGQREIDSVGAGFSQREAIQNSYSRAASQITIFSRDLLHAE